MFARRIAIVSLMTLLFALVASRIVAEAGRERQMRVDGGFPCSHAAGCATAHAR